MTAAEDLLLGLDPAQREAALAVTGPVLIRAGAGSGKTRTITHRIAYAVAIGAQRADRGLAVTFTTKSAGQMRSRLADLGVPAMPVMTFHAAALRQLRHFWPLAVGGRAPDLLPSKTAVLSEAAASQGLPRDRVLLRDIAAEIEWAKASRVRADDYPDAAAGAGRTPPGALSLADVAILYRRYADLLAERSQMDFEDVLSLTAGLLADRPDLADQVRQRYQWFTVDEYQDVSAIQQHLLSLWLGDSDQVCAVGDPGQTIYTFAGASPQYIHGFQQWFPSAARVDLQRTYRCSPQIVASANRVLAGGPDGGSFRLASTKPDGPAVQVHGHDDDLAEAAAIAGTIGGWLQAGVAAREIAVLVRTNAATVPIEDALADAGIPHVVTGGERFFSRPEIREAIARLRGAAKALPEGAGPAQALAEVLAAMGFEHAAAPQGRGAGRDRWESLAALAALGGDGGPLPPTATVRALVNELDRRAGLDAAPVADAVTVATLHAAKGLEWDAVCIAGVQEGSLPISYADTAERVEEERRLLYVGVTRARNQLVLNWSVARSGDRGRRRAPSRFLRDIDPGVGEPKASARGPRRRRKESSLGACRLCGKGLPTPAERAMKRCRTCPETVDLALLERLKAWRTEQAVVAGAPAYTIFTDVTLQAIAELKPTSESALLAVSGVGPLKLERFGAALLELVGEQ